MGSQGVGNIFTVPDLLLHMQDAPGVSCSCHQHKHVDGSANRESTGIDNQTDLRESTRQDRAADIPGETNETADRCSDCGAQFEWSLRLDGVTERVCPDCN